MTNSVKFGIYSKGEILLVECQNGVVYSGLFLSQAERKISLYGVTEFPSLTYVECKITFDISEIISIKRVIKNVHESVLIDDDAVDYDFFKWIHLSAEVSYKVISMTDNVYFDAIEHLKNSAIVAIDSRGTEFGRQHKMSILMFATHVQIYIFDLKKLNFLLFSTGLREVLESNYIVKICHDCRKLADCLFHSYKVTLNNVFDSQVADMIIQKQTHPMLNVIPRSFADVVNNYMHLPKGLFCEKEIRLNEWFERPIQQYLRDCIAIKVSFMLVLHLKLKRMMNPNLYAKFDNVLQQTSFIN